MDKKKSLEKMITDLHYQYPWEAETANTACPRCGDASCGGSLCSNCLTMDLAELVGGTLAGEYQRQVAIMRHIYWSMTDKISNVQE